MKIISLLILATLIGCTPDRNVMMANVMAANKKELAGHGENVGVLPDGRNIIRYRLERGDYLADHWIYVVDGGGTTTLNVYRNKSHYVEVTIDGQKYNLSLTEVE